jgi:hypothetical protein
MGFRTYTLTVKRSPGGSFVDGLWVPQDFTESTISASVQPLTPQEMDLLPVARRNSQTFKVFTSERLYPALEGGANADRVVFESEDYEVISCAEWQNKIIPHYCAVISGRVPTLENPPPPVVVP